MRVIQKAGRGPLRSTGIWGAAEGQTQKKRGGGSDESGGASGDGGGQKKIAAKGEELKEDMDSLIEEIDEQDIIHQQDPWANPSLRCAHAAGPPTCRKAPNNSGRVRSRV